jgi:hypothetical protein
MKLRIEGLSAVDPLAVPLPVGTEVITRVDRTLEGRTDAGADARARRVPSGAIGRVTAVLDDEVRVEIVGVGSLVYAREDVTPRKPGQLRFAHRREAAWSALRPCVVLETVVGSHAWGLADAGSDTDVRGVFVLPFSWTIGLAEPPLDLVSADGSTTYWELGKVVRQALRADPNTLETLFLPAATPRDAMGEWLLAAREAFVSAEIYGTFGRYALSQLKRLRQSLRLAEHRHLVLEWLREDPGQSLDQLASRLARETGLEASAPEDAHLRAKEYVKQLYGSLYDQGLLASRDYQGLMAFAATSAHEFELPRTLRPKNAYNLLRLIATATTWLETGRAELEMRGALREELWAIKRGEVPLEDVLARAEDLAVRLETARQHTALPARADAAAADALLRRVREEAARRWFAGGPGPFGADAPPYPEAAWE